MVHGQGTFYRKNKDLIIGTWQYNKYIEDVTATEKE
jgi:hypothetical protein